MPRMLRACAVLAGGMLVVSTGRRGQLPAQPPVPVAASDTRIDAAEKEIAALKLRASQQDQRIRDLERTVRQLQAAVRTGGRPVPTNWRSRDGWILLKLGMSRAEVVDILGEPKTSEAVMDRQTLRYADAEPVGSVVLTDDRVSEISSDKFKVYAPTEK